MILYATKLRAFAILAVLLIHISIPLVRQEVGSFEWWVGNVVDGSMRWAVPIFIMLSGMLLLGKTESQLTVVKKRVPRLLLPLLLWSLLYSIWDVRHDMHDYSFQQFLINLYQNDVKYHLWYLYTLLGLYLAMPIFKTFIQHGRKSDLLYFILLDYVISATFEVLASLLDIRLGNGFGYFLGYGGYFLLGYYLANTSLNKRTTNLIHLLGSSALLVTIFGTWFFSAEQGSLNQVFYKYLSLTTPIVSASVFLLIKNFWNTENSRLTTVIADYSFGIYLIHPMILDVLQGEKFIQVTGISAVSIHPILYVVLMFIVVLAFSLLFTSILSKIPLIKKFL
ncbi:MAG: acyltransferase [Bacillota bacterium]